MTSPATFSPAFKHVSFVFPCFNEEENLSRFEKEVFEYFDAVGFSYECILIDDGSSDNTWAAAQALAARRPEVLLVRHPINRGLGAALRTGISRATGDVVITMDADLTFSPSEVLKLVQRYRPGVDCVIGSPLTGEFREVPFRRRVMSDGVNRMYRFLLAKPITATSSILRLYRTSCLKEIDLQSTGFDINAEIVFRLIKRGSLIQEVPVVLTTRTLGYSKIRTLPEINNHIKMFFRILKWKYS